MTTLRARISQGNVEIQDPIPREWEGLQVKIVPLTPDEPLADLEERLTFLQALGPSNTNPVSAKSRHRRWANWTASAAMPCATS